MVTISADDDFDPAFVATIVALLLIQSDRKVLKLTNHLDSII